VAWLKDARRVAEQSGRLALAEHRPKVRDQDAPHLEAVEGLFQQQLFHPPSTAELAEKTAIAPATLDRLLRILQEHQRLVPVGEGLLFHQEAIQAARRLLVEHIRTQGRLESVDFKYLLDTTRKFALPLLDYFDRTGLLRRAGNTRFLKSPP
jgi:selenocysteine-specific elongation factor